MGLSGDWIDSVWGNCCEQCLLKAPAQSQAQLPRQHSSESNVCCQSFERLHYSDLEHSNYVFPLTLKLI